VIHDLAAAQVHLRDRRHLIVRQGKIPDVEVLFHALPADGLGDDGDPALDVPAQRHLRGRLPVSLPDPGKRRMGEDTVLPLRQGAPRLGTHPFANPAAEPKLE